VQVPHLGRCRQAGGERRRSHLLVAQLQREAIAEGFQRLGVELLLLVGRHPPWPEVPMP
jgi:hypothetical protein